MGKTCKFSTKWKELDDQQGNKVGDWATSGNDPHEAYCVVCEGNISVKAKGVQALLQHASKEKHKRNMIKLSPDQLRLKLERGPRKEEVSTSAPATRTSAASSQDMPLREGTIQIYSVRDQTTKAEILWTLKCVACNFSASSCTNVGDTFKAMFGENEVTSSFSLGRTKASYLINEALAPYYALQQKEAMKNCYYTLLFDETTNSAGRKELQTGVRFWSETEKGVVFEHLETFFIGQAKADDLKQKLQVAMDHAELSSSHLLMLGMDGPNVNKAVWREINADIVKCRKRGLVDIGSCNIHTIHNAYRRGIEELGQNASDILYFLHNFFDGWPARWDAFSEICRKLNITPKKFLRHVPQRWLTIRHAGERALELWDAVLSYFLDVIPRKEEKRLTDSAPYRRIVALLKQPTIKAEVSFVVSSAKMFEAVTLVFQKEEPLVHLLYLELKELVGKLISRSCVNSSLTYTEIFCSANLKPPENVVVDGTVASALASANDLDKMAFLNRARSHYVESCNHIITKSSYKSSILRNLRCLHPVERKKTFSFNAIVAVSEALPLNIATDQLRDEWALLQDEKDPAIPDGLNTVEEMRIDHYWRHFFDLKNPTGGERYPRVTKVVKAALTLSHGQADVERGFSLSCRILTDDRASMNERTLNSFLTVRSMLKRYDNKPHLVPITKELMNKARIARQLYQEYLDEQKRQKELAAAAKEAEEEQRKKDEERRKSVNVARKKLEEELKTLQDQRGQEETKLKRADKLLEDVDKRLKSGIENGDMEEVALAQAMLTSVKKLRDEANEQRKIAKETEKRAEKRRLTILDYMSVSKLRKD